MPMVVPRTQEQPAQRPKIDPTYLAMAAAIMDAKGKFNPKAEDGKEPNVVAG